MAHVTGEHSERRLIVNADDLGLSTGVTRGILELAHGGVVTSTSLLVNLPGSAAALAAAQQADLDVGLHLNICAGVPLSPPHLVSSLLQPGSRSRARRRFITAGAITWRLARGRLRIDEVEREWSAQLEWLLARGARPSHLDSHCHLHSYPALHRLILRLARRHGIPGVRHAAAGFIVPAPLPRLPLLRYAPGLPNSLGNLRRRATHAAAPALPGVDGPDHFSVLTVMGRLATPRRLEALLRALPDGVTELVCHPGHVDEELRLVDTLTDGRRRELLLLAHPAFRATLAREGIHLISWADLASGTPNAQPSTRAHAT